MYLNILHTYIILQDEKYRSTDFIEINKTGPYCVII